LIKNRTNPGNQQTPINIKPYMNFKLQPYSGPQSRYTCPQCNHRAKTFVRYVDTATGNQLAEHVGRCNRQDQCGYHFKPGQFFRDQRGAQPRRIYLPTRWPCKTLSSARPNLPPDYIPAQLVNQSFTAYNNNNFVRYLEARFGFAIANELVGRYRIGTSRHWLGATVFWQLDAEGNVRTGKVMLYNPETGKRVRQPYNHITWAHKIIGKGEASGPLNNYNLKQCLFGEHLLVTDPYKPVAIVESEKTAIIASVVIPKFVWLASGSLEGLSAQKCKVLQGREIMLFPDVNAYDKWQLKAMQLQMAIPGSVFLVSGVLERLATQHQRQQGIDIGDLAGW
jgi:hypothetical protein